MSEQTVDARPEVVAFVARVRDLMADLDADERQDLTIGLEADLSELVAEHGAEALGDPAHYAAELRVAAGHAPTMGARGGRWSFRDAVMDALDAARAHWERLLDALPYGGPRGFLAALQPAWWVARGWVAWMVAQDVRGPYVVLDGPWAAALVVLVVLSVQAGRRGWGLGRLLDSSVLARLLLVALNVFAITMLPGAVDRASNQIAENGAWMYWHEGASPEVNPDVVTFRGEQACVLRVFDADGNRVRGGYVWDATGERRLPMNSRDC